MSDTEQEKKAVGQRGRKFSSRYNNESKRLDKSMGMTDSIPYLEIRPNSSVSAEGVQNYLEKARTYCIANFCKDLDEIFLKNGKYPEIEEPTEPDQGELKNPVIVAKWNLKYKKYEADISDLEKDKPKLFGVLKGNIGKNSLEKIKQTEKGSEAITEKDPLKLVQAIIATHLVAGKADNDQNLYSAQQNYNKLIMGDVENIGRYYERFKANLASLCESAKRAEAIDTLPGDGMQALHFVNTLSAYYREYAQYVQRGIKDKPKDLETAYRAAVDFGPSKPSYTQRQGIFLSSRGGRGGRGRGRGGRGRGACHDCGEFGHWKGSDLCTKPSGKNNESENIDRAITHVKKDRDEKSKSKNVRF